MKDWNRRLLRTLDRLYMFLRERKRNVWIAALICGSTVFVLGTAIACYAKSAQSELASQFIRFHVLANSDTDEDQALKLKVRDAVLEDMREYLESSTSLQETRESLEQNLSRIRQVALSVLRQEGCGYDVTVSLEPSQFPTKRYGNISLPAGSYEALRIQIGEARGHNWWCVMFPPLCFVEESEDQLPQEEEEQLDEILTEDQNKLIHYEEESWSVKIKFKLIEWWQELFG